MEYSLQVLNENVKRYGYRPRALEERVGSESYCRCSDCQDDCERDPIAFIHTGDEKYSIPVCEHAADSLNLIQSFGDITDYDTRTDVPSLYVINALFGEGENRRERRLTFRRLKKLYLAGKLSYTPVLVCGKVSLRGREVKARNSFTEIASAWLRATRPFAPMSNGSSSGYPFFDF